MYWERGGFRCCEVARETNIHSSFVPDFKEGSATQIIRA